jgi:hypothetical protein
MTNYLGSYVKTLSRDIIDYMSCFVTISTNIPRVKIFRFENYWMMHEDFLQIVEHGWNFHNNQTDRAKIMTKISKILEGFLDSGMFNFQI